MLWNFLHPFVPHLAAPRGRRDLLTEIHSDTVSVRSWSDARHRAAGAAIARSHAVQISSREFTLLEAFMRSPGQVLGHTQLMDAAWDIGHEYRSNVIEVYIRYLREKIDRPFGVQPLETVRGLGYRLRRDSGG